MGHIISVHSYRGGTGKSNLTANLAYQAARRGRRAAVLDTDVQSPGVHMVLGLRKERLAHSLTDYLFDKCDLEEAAYNLTNDLGLEDSGGALFLLPSSMSVDSILRIAAEGYDAGRLNDHISIDVIASPHNASLLEADRRISRVISWDGSPLSLPGVVLKARRKKYDLVLQLILGKTTNPAVIAGLCSGRGHIVGRGNSYNRRLFDHFVRGPQSPHFAEQTYSVLLDGVDFSDPPEIPDYHIDLPQSDNQRLSLFPHFYDFLKPGWFDKRLSWRRPQPLNVDRMILVSPSPAFVARLPNAKIPDRRDFVAYSTAERIRAWRTVIDRCRELADDFAEVLDSNRLAERLKPF